MKKRLSSALAATLVLGTVVPTTMAAQSSFTDIGGSYARDAINELVSKGIINGMDSTHFAPQSPLTRAQFTKLIVTALHIPAAATASSFSDVSGWSVSYIEAAFNAGLIQGVGDGKFEPNGIVTREQAAVILVNALTHISAVNMDATASFGDFNQVSDWAKSFIAVAQKYNLIKGDGVNFYPQQNTTREQAAIMIENLLRAITEMGKEYKITPQSVSMNVGETKQFKVENSDSVTWSVSGNGTIDQNGNFTAASSGTATITALVNAIKPVTATVTINAVSGGGGYVPAPVPQPAAPAVEADDENNVIINIDTSMEYSIDSAAYTKYDGKTPPGLSGDHIVLVRIAATGSTPAGKTKTLYFTEQLSNPTLTVFAPNVDQAWMGYKPNTVFQVNVNFISGITSSNFKAAEVTLYNGDTKLASNTAKQQLLDSNSVGLTDLFAIGDTENITDDPNWNIGAYPSTLPPTNAVFKLTNKNNVVHIAEAPLTVVAKPDAPKVTADDTANKIVGLDTTMEFKVDDQPYTQFTGDNPPNLTGTHTVKVRVATVGTTPAGNETTLTFTENPAVDNPPAKVKNLVVTTNDTKPNKVGGVQNILTWDANTESDFDHYEVRRDEGQDTTQVKIGDFKVTKVTDTNVEPGKTYYYTVVAVDSASQASESSRVSVQTAEDKQAIAPEITNVHLESSNADKTKAKAGDTVKLTFITMEEIFKLPYFKINGNDPTTFVCTKTGDNYTTTATYIISDSDPEGNVTFQINVMNLAGLFSVPTKATTDGSTVAVLKAPVISNVHIQSNNAVTTKAQVGDTVSLSFTTKQQVEKLGNFKINGSNPTTFSCTQAGDSWTTVATYMIEESEPDGIMNFQINVKNGVGLYSVTTEKTTDASSVTIAKADFASGQGTDTDPYVITTPRHLNHVRDHLSSHFKLARDIDLNVVPFNQGTGWQRDATTLDNPFVGFFDGNGKTIKNLYMNKPTNSGGGLFGIVKGTIRNLSIENVDITVQKNAGGLAQALLKGGSVINCSATGSITSTGTGLAEGDKKGQIGGLIGFNYGGTVDKCIAQSVTIKGFDRIGGLVGANWGIIKNSHVTGATVTGTFSVGGLTGQNYSDQLDANRVYATIMNSSADAAVIATRVADSRVGGIAGESSGAKILDSYASGSVKGTKYVGGLVGVSSNFNTMQGIVQNCYSNNTVEGTTEVGGLLGNNNTGEPVVSSYYDSTVTPQSDSDRGTPKTSDTMKQQSTYVGWDFNNTWIMELNQYPRLRP